MRSSHISFVNVSSKSLKLLKNISQSSLFSIKFKTDIISSIVIFSFGISTTIYISPYSISSSSKSYKY